MLDIEKELRSGKRQFVSKKGHNIKLDIQARGLGGRYKCLIITEHYTTGCETPNFVEVEGPLQFYERLASAVLAVMRDLDS